MENLVMATDEKGIQLAGIMIIPTVRCVTTLHHPPGRQNVILAMA